MGENHPMTRQVERQDEARSGGPLSELRLREEGNDPLSEVSRRGWQIGSGPTESQCKLCTKRLKGYGRRWDRPNATAVAALDTLERNGQWRQVWPNACPAAV